MQHGGRSGTKSSMKDGISGHILHQESPGVKSQARLPTTVRLLASLLCNSPPTHTHCTQHNCRGRLSKHSWERRSKSEFVQLLQPAVAKKSYDFELSGHLLQQKIDGSERCTDLSSGVYENLSKNLNLQMPKQSFSGQVVWLSALTQGHTHFTSRSSFLCGPLPGQLRSACTPSLVPFLPEYACASGACIEYQLCNTCYPAMSRP